MFFKNSLILKSAIDEYRQNMHKLAKEKGVLDPEVIKISQELDMKIVILQKVLFGSSFSLLENPHKSYT